MMALRHILSGRHMYHSHLSTCLLQKNCRLAFVCQLKRINFLFTTSQCSQAGSVGVVEDVFVWTYRQAQVSTDILGYTFKTTFLFSSKNKTLSELILSGTQQGSGMPGMIPTAFTMLWIVAWFDGLTTWNRKGNAYYFIYEKSFSQEGLENDYKCVCRFFCLVGFQKRNICDWVTRPHSTVMPWHFQPSCTGCVQVCMPSAAFINTRGGHWWHRQQSAAWKENRVHDGSY